MQPSSPTGEVTGEAANHEVALLAGTLDAVLVVRRCTYLPIADLGGAVVGLPFFDGRTSLVNSAKMVSMSRPASGLDIGPPSVHLPLERKRVLCLLSVRGASNSRDSSEGTHAFSKASCAHLLLSSAFYKQA